jgi:ATP-dependent DNA helicase PIF1
MLVEPTRLYSHNADVDRQNSERLRELPGAVMIYEAKDSGTKVARKILQHCAAPSELRLKPQAQVILLKNLDMNVGLANGTRGVVIGFRSSAVNPEEEGKRGGGAGEEDGAVATATFPVVKFALANGGFVTKCVGPSEWSIEEGLKTIATRKQVPLKLAWALSIHKSQGMTIELLEADVGKCFDFGQCYVALSRAVSLPNLRVLNFNPRNVRANQRVIEFNSRLESVQTAERGGGDPLHASHASHASTNERVLLAFYQKHAPEKATAETVRMLLKTFSPEVLRNGIETKYGTPIGLLGGDSATE